MDRNAYILAPLPRQARVDARALFEVSGEILVEEDQTPRARMKPVAPRALVVILPRDEKPLIAALQLLAVAALLLFSQLQRRR